MDQKKIFFSRKLFAEDAEIHRKNKPKRGKKTAKMKFFESFRNIGEQKRFANLRGWIREVQKN